MPRMELVKFHFGSGYASDLSITSDRIGYGSGYLRQGTVNALVTGAGLIVPFKGLTEVAGIVGSRLNFLTDNGFVGLGDQDTAGFGSVFKAIGLLFFMGGGALAVNGVLVDDDGDEVLASSQFQYLVKDSGQFTNGDDEHRFDVGHARPSAPSVYQKTPPSSGQKPMNAVVAIAVWRADSLTGQPSLPSESVNLTLSNASAIIQFPAADNNGQDVWGIGGTLLGIQIGNIYELPTSQNGEVLESTLAYTRTVTATVTNTDATITLDGATPLADQFTSADIGRRVVRGSDQDSWIISITDGFNAECNDNATGTSTGSATITHAVDGYTRAVEVSWSDDDLMANATIAPFTAFEPMDGRFAGFVLDTFFIEDLEGTIFYSIPNFLSFPRKYNKIFTEDQAVIYINTGRGFQWRLSEQSVSRLFYAPGLTPINLDIRAKNIGCKYPPNACLGYDSRLMFWSGSPTVVDTEGGFNSTLHTIVMSEFEGWEDQTETEPVVTAFDPAGKYELWCKGNKIMAMHGPTGRWCSPIYIDDWCGAGSKVVSSVIVDERLRLVINRASTTRIRVTLAGDVGSRGYYSQRGTSGGKNYYNMEGEATSTTLSVIKWSSSKWRIIDEAGTLLYSSTQDVATPDLVTVWVDEGGGLPLPTVAIGRELVHFKWNVGSGSDMTLRSYHRQLPAQTTISEVQSVIKAGATAMDINYTLIGDFDRELVVGTDSVLAAADSTDNQVATTFRPNFRGCTTVAIDIEIPGADGHAAVDYVNLFGEWNETHANPRAL